MTHYVALIHKDANSDFGVSFPDFPGCVTAVTTIDDARVMAEKALAFHLEGMVEDGDALPAPSLLDDFIQTGALHDAVAFLVEATITEDRL